MSRVDHWRIHKLYNGNRIKSGTLGNTRHKVHKISDRYPIRGISQFHKLEWNNNRKMLGKPTLRRVHLVRAHIQHRKKFLMACICMEVSNH